MLKKINNDSHSQSKYQILHYFYLTYQQKFTSAYGKVCLIFPTSLIYFHTESKNLGITKRTNSYLLPGDSKKVVPIKVVQSAFKSGKSILHQTF